MIDKNRPQVRRTAPHGHTGIVVVEFKDQPGEYFDLRGGEVPETTARAAGYDVEAGRRAKRKRELETEARKRVEKQVAEEFGDIDEQLDEEFKDGGLEVKQIDRRWGVVDADGRVLVNDLSKREADQALADLRTRGDQGVQGAS